MTVSNVRPSSAMPTASTSEAYHARSEELANFRENLMDKDLKGIQELGQGNGGSVEKIERTLTGGRSARSASDLCRREGKAVSQVICVSQQKVREGRGGVNMTRKHAYLLGHNKCPCGESSISCGNCRSCTTAAHLFSRRVHLRLQHLYLLELMDGGPLDGIYKQIGPIGIDVVRRSRWLCWND